MQSDTLAGTASRLPSPPHITKRRSHRGPVTSCVGPLQSPCRRWSCPLHQKPKKLPNTSVGRTGSRRTGSDIASSMNAQRNSRKAAPYHSTAIVSPTMLFLRRAALGMTKLRLINITILPAAMLVLMAETIDPYHKVIEPNDGELSIPLVKRGWGGDDPAKALLAVSARKRTTTISRQTG